MRTLLHIVTKAEDALAEQVIQQQRELSEVRVQVVDLNRNDPDYPALLEAIFDADSVQVW